MPVFAPYSLSFRLVSLVVTRLVRFDRSPHLPLISVFRCTRLLYSSDERATKQTRVVARARNWCATTLQPFSPSTTTFSPSLVFALALNFALALPHSLFICIHFLNFLFSKILSTSSSVFVFVFSQHTILVDLAPLSDQSAVSSPSFWPNPAFFFSLFSFVRSTLLTILLHYLDDHLSPLVLARLFLLHSPSPAITITHRSSTQITPSVVRNSSIFFIIFSVLFVDCDSP